MSVRPNSRLEGDSSSPRRKITPKESTNYVPIRAPQVSRPGQKPSNISVMDVRKSINKITTLLVNETLDSLK